MLEWPTNESCLTSAVWCARVLVGQTSVPDEAHPIHVLGAMHSTQIGQKVHRKGASRSDRFVMGGRYSRSRLVYVRANEQTLGMRWSLHTRSALKYTDDPQNDPVQKKRDIQLLI